MNESAAFHLTKSAQEPAFVEYGKSMRSTVSFRKPRPQHWYSLAIGRSRFNLSLTANTRLHRIGCELYIRHPRYSKKAFALLFAQKDAIESELGPLDWQELPHRRDCRIAQYHAMISTIAPSGLHSTRGCWNDCRHFVESLLIVYGHWNLERMTMGRMIPMTPSNQGLEPTAYSMPLS
jgi:Domain of unknown function (DUF4268)